MQASEFLAAVLPPPDHGFYCAAELGVKKEHAFVTSIEAVVQQATIFDEDKKDAYFGLSTFLNSGRRTAANARFIRSLFADIDCGDGKAYPTQLSAIEAVSAWCETMRFDVPYIVSSGGGLHCYWPFTEAVTVAIWQPIAEAFKRSCAAHDLRIDFSVSADAARVLRVPGTRNFKHNKSRKVVFRLEGEQQAASHYATLLQAYKTPAKLHAIKVGDSFAALGEAPAFALGAPSYVTDMQELSRVRFSAIVERGEQGCKQIAHYMSNASADGIEPLWRGVMSIAKYTVEGEEKAHELAAMHPYDVDRTAKKISEIKGPYSCTALASTNPGVCETCPHWGKITNPLALGRELNPDVPHTHTEIPVQTGSVKAAIEYPDLPAGYIVADRGVGISYSDAEGIPRIAYISDTPFYATATYDRAGERFVQFTYAEHSQAKSVVLPMAVATARDDSIKAFAKMGIIVPTGQDAGFRSYVKASIAIAKQSPPQSMPTSLGWQPDDTFAFDGRVFSPSGEVGVPMYGMENLNDLMGVKGSIDGWRLVVASVIRMGRWDLLAMLSIGFASPLMRFTGLNGITFHLCGNDSGRGKTLAQRLASSVWGVPDKFRITPNTSAVAMVNRLGLLGNLPLMVDEITHKGRADTEWFPEFLSQMSDGRGKDRMESSTNQERRNTTTWSSIALMTSNKHMMDYLTAERDHGSEGEIRRLIEMTFDKPLLMDELTKTLLFETLPENYGAAGEMYVRWLVRNVDLARRTTKETYEEIFKQFDATGDERFWVAGCAAIISAVRLVGKHGANIIDLPLGKIAQCLYEAVVSMRMETKRTKRTAMDVLNEFTKRNYGKLVMVDKESRIARLAGVEVAETLDRKDLCGRVERGATVGWIDYFIEERELKAFCSSLSYGYREFKEDLRQSCALRVMRKDLLMGTKGPSMSVACVHIKQQNSAAPAEIMLASNDG